jgi:hypothetical protein
LAGLGQWVVVAIRRSPSPVCPVATSVNEQVITRSSGICPLRKPMGATTAGGPTPLAAGTDGDVARNGAIFGQLIRKVKVVFCGAPAAAAGTAPASAETTAAAKMIGMRRM